MTSGVDDRREPLWAASLAQQPRPSDDAVGPTAKDAEPTPPRDVREPVKRPAVAVVAVGALIAVALIAALPRDGSLSVENVSSAWGHVLMRCHTARVEQDERVLEVFNCHAVDGGNLPPGVYRSPAVTWTSDIDRRDARASDIRISPDGDLVGWAVY